LVPTTADAVLAFIAAAAIAWLLVPLSERLAFRVGAIDLPKERGLHDRPMPRLSGLAILVAVEVAGWIWLPNDGQSRSILIGAIAIAAVGVIDDVQGLSAFPKLVGQIAAAAIPVAAGVRVDNLTLPFLGGFELGWTAYPLTILGIVAVVNVINFLDGVDGLAAGVCTIAAVTLAAIALSLERNSAGVLAALTAGAALGFLRHGFPPASSFMGDTGSNLLGFLLATASVQGALKTNAVIALAFPLVVLAVPILDTGFVVAKRLKYRQPIYQADSWHFHHRMANIGFSQRRTIAYLYAWTVVMAGLALALRFVPYSDNHGHFHAGWTALMLSRLRTGDPQAAPGPDQPGNRRVRGTRAGGRRDGARRRLPEVVATLTIRMDKPFSGPFVYSRGCARSAPSRA
jgi:UDP-GlcNAc:undecaprenyl-phosphate GlcNAc-1-phosphate transferase